MHSRSKIRMFYPELGIETARAQENDSYALWDFYGKVSIRKTILSFYQKIIFKATPPNQRDYEMETVDDIDLNEFYRATYPDFLIISCKYKRGTCRFGIEVLFSMFLDFTWLFLGWNSWKKTHEIQSDFTDQWTTELTMYGRCKSFVDDHGTSDVDDGISDATFRTLQLVLAYNTSDWTYGWSYYMDGFSIFYSPKGEVVLDHMVDLFILIFS